MRRIARANPSDFLDDFDAATMPCPVSTSGSRMFPDVPISIDLEHYDGEHYATLNMFEAHPGIRGTGAGTEAMRRLLDLADKHGLIIFLDPHPLDAGWSWARLVKWYASFGFVFEEEDEEDREASGNRWMMRVPDAKGARRPNPRTRARRRADFPKAYYDLVALAPVLQDRIYDYFKPLRHLDGANEMLAQMLRDAGYRVIGVGGVRVVVDVGEGFAAKVACDAYGDQQNRAEAAFWKAHPLPDLIMPVHAFSQDGSISQDGTVLLTERAETPVSEAEARAGWERLAKHPQGRLIGETDFPFQWGRHGGKVKLLDYGDNPLRPNPRRRWNPRNPQTETSANSAAFRRWFGDSKVVDARGEPLVVYHGTSATFDTFDVGLSWDGGFHFGTAEAATNRIADGAGLDPERWSTSVSPSIMPVYLSIKDPRRLNYDPIDEETWAFVIGEAKDNGYDGVVYPNSVEGGESWVAFDPRQIKSATGNAGTFDPDDASILRNPRTRRTRSRR